MLDSPRTARWLIFAALVVSLIIRLHFSQHARFGEDIGTAYATAFDMVHRGVFPQGGGATTWGGKLVLPGYWYVCAPPLLFTTSVRVFAGWGALFCWLGMIPFALLLYERYGPRAAVLGTWFASTAPLFVVLTDAPWSPKMAVPFVSLLMYALHRVVAVPKSRWAAAVPLCLLGQAQVYPAVPATVAMVVAVAVWCRPQVIWRWVGIGSLVAALIVAPTAFQLMDPAPEPAPEAPSSSRLMSKRREFNRLKSAALSVQYSVLYSTSFGKYGSLGKGSILPKTKHPWRDQYRNLRVALGGPFVVVFAFLSLLVALGAWLRGAVQGVQKLRTPGRTWDPVGVSLVASVLASALVAAFGARMFIPRYNYLFLWLSLLPMIWLIGGDRPLRSPRLQKALVVFVLTSVPINLYATKTIYTRDLPPLGIATTLSAMERIVERRHGQPFDLKVHRWQRDGWELVGSRLYGRRWNTATTADTVYQVVAKPASRQERRYFRRLRRAGAKVYRVPYANLFEVPATKRRMLRTR